jgi:hypothetical protein
MGEMGTCPQCGGRRGRGRQINHPPADGQGSGDEGEGEKQAEKGGGAENGSGSGSRRRQDTGAATPWGGRVMETRGVGGQVGGGEEAAEVGNSSS